MIILNRKYQISHFLPKHKYPRGFNIEKYVNLSDVTARYGYIYFHFTVNPKCYRNCLGTTVNLRHWAIRWYLNFSFFTHTIPVRLRRSKQFSHKNLGFLTQWCTHIGLYWKKSENIFGGKIESVMGDIKVPQHHH